MCVHLCHNAMASTCHQPDLKIKNTWVNYSFQIVSLKEKGVPAYAQTSVTSSGGKECLIKQKMSFFVSCKQGVGGGAKLEVVSESQKMGFWVVIYEFSKKKACFLGFGDIWWGLGQQLSNRLEQKKSVFFFPSILKMSSKKCGFCLKKKSNSKSTFKKAIKLNHWT